jgi:hypothetical protein
VKIALLVNLGVGFGWADKLVYVTGLKFVGVVAECFYVGDAVITGTGFEYVFEGERSQHGVTARATAADNDSAWVNKALLCEVVNSRNTIVYVVNTLVAIEFAAVFSAIAAAASVVEIEKREAAAGSA